LYLSLNCSATRRQTRFPRQLPTGSYGARQRRSGEKISN
jgi:hypothetical protein